MEWTMVTMVFVGPWATTRKTLVILMHEVGYGVER